jgi:hypothetical protein
MNRIARMPACALLLLSACGQGDPDQRANHEASIPDSVRTELIRMGVEDQAAREGFFPEKLQDTLFLKSMLPTLTDLAHRGAVPASEVARPWQVLWLGDRERWWSVRPLLMGRNVG